MTLPFAMDSQSIIFATKRMASMTRLYTSETDFVDVPTSDITEMAESQEIIAAEAKPRPTLNEVISAASDKHQIDADLITSVIHAESAFNPDARSPKGAQELMQLMPSTASQLGVKDAYDPAANVDEARSFSASCWSNTTGTLSRHWPLTMPGRDEFGNTTASRRITRRARM